MGFELILLGCLIFMFIVSFCGLLQKIKHSYEHDRAVADRIARRHEANSTVSDSFVNTTYIETESGIFPGAPPPYSHVESPPKYEDIIKSETAVTIDRTSLGVRETSPISRSATVPCAPPPYTICV